MNHTRDYLWQEKRKILRFLPNKKAEPMQGKALAHMHQAM
ncbi:MAG: hypothetical protein JETT_3323 [Candidatus Jettenia ecosi]|uniref:Uncharacterized protein n=1 Tax=Candidatus Jettenia ecosi TaxID=2494326 RepID=A0A533Q769_9BACT|nr:MAG: hypothetical protein JETT_3323 [Candidatus Jettenia ecosi]